MLAEGEQNSSYTLSVNMRQQAISIAHAQLPLILVTPEYYVSIQLVYFCFTIKG